MKSFRIFENKKSQQHLNKELLDASRTGDLDKVKELISKGVNIETRDKYGYTPLNITSSKGKLNIVKYLVEQGANIETKNMFNWTPLAMSIIHNQYDIIE